MMFRLGVVASVVSFCLIISAQAKSTALRQPAKAAISTVQATHALFTAAAVGDRAAAVRWLAAGADATAKNDDGKRPFQVAIDADHDALTAILLKAAGGVNGRDEQGWTPLNWAILSGDWQLVQEFIRAGADIAAGHQSAWVVAKLMESEMQLIETIIAARVDAVVDKQSLIAAMRLAVKEGHIGVLRRLGEQGWTLLNCAILSGDWQLVREFIIEGANITAGSQNPWEVAELMGSEMQLIETIIAAVVDKQSLVAAMRLAVKERHIEMVRRLIDGVYANSWGGALGLAGWLGHIEIIKLLIDYGVDPNTVDDAGNAAVGYAASNGNTETVKMLIEEGANMEDALKWAVFHRRTEIVKMLIDGGADLNARSAALDIAERFRRKEIAAIIRAAEGKR